MAYMAKYVQRGDDLDYIPAKDIAAGDVIFLGDGPLAAVAKVDIPAGKLGALSVTGVYDMVHVKEPTPITIGMEVSWDEMSKGVIVGGSKKIGIALSNAGATDTHVRVLLNA